MTTYTITDVRQAAAALASEAIRAGVMPAGAEIRFYPGSRVNGISPKFDVAAADSLQRPTFLPEFTYKSTPREMVFALDAARLALNAVNSL